MAWAQLPSPTPSPTLRANEGQSSHSLSIRMRPQGPQPQTFGHRNVMALGGGVLHECRVGRKWALGGNRGP